MQKLIEFIRSLFKKKSTPAPTPAVIEEQPTVDAIDLTECISLGRHRGTRPQNAKITKRMVSAKQQGSKVNIVFEKLGWPTKTGDNGKTCDGGVYIYWKSFTGEIVGGFFDHHGLNQTIKVLDNIPAGYLDGQWPNNGDDVYFGIVSYDGSERTNFIKAAAPWKSF